MSKGDKIGVITMDLSTASNKVYWLSLQLQFHYNHSVQFPKTFLKPNTKPITQQTPKTIFKWLFQWLERGNKRSSQRSIFHCVKSVRIRSYSGPHFPAFGLNTERYGVSLCIQSECGKMRTRITPNTDTFHAMFAFLYYNFN